MKEKKKKRKKKKEKKPPTVSFALASSNICSYKCHTVIAVFKISL